ncbi:hypothetical protein AAH678_23870 [Sodalis endosymbiont of Spalangia cameroni]|uniref:hypothetical protein n=1 Tax=Sodalis praecaptivus TaxID=1239307 RepID=UPI0031FA3089
MDKEVIYTDSTTAADGRDGPAVAAHSALASASVHPPNVELAITPSIEPLPPGNALLKLSTPEQTGGERGAFSLHSAPATVRKTRSAGAPFIPPYVAEQRRSILHLLIREPRKT